jgi:hypothetical protein
LHLGYAGAEPSRAERSGVAGLTKGRASLGVGRWGLDMRKSRKELPDAAALDRLQRQRTRNWKEEFKYDAVREIERDALACHSNTEQGGVEEARGAWPLVTPPALPRSRTGPARPGPALGAWGAKQA